MWSDLQSQYAGQIEFIVVDRDSDSGGAFARSHGIYYQPGFVVFDSAGNRTYNGLGPSTESGLRTLVASAAGG